VGHNASSIAANIVDLLSSPATRWELESAAAAVADAIPTWDQVVQPILDWLESV
jgi:hypothetical protein